MSELGKICSHSNLARQCYFCELEDERDKWKAMAERLAEKLAAALKDTSILCAELRRTMDDGHWFADDLNRVGERAKDALAAYEQAKGKEQG